MHYTKHCIKCQEILGESFGYIHKWLDEFADGNYIHRRHRHHEEGIELVRLKWGDRAAIAARIHIEQDWGYVPQKTDYNNIVAMKRKYYIHRGFLVTE